MDSTWPAEERDRRRIEAPLFPLPGVFLFPGQLLPLHVFEPRYRQMVEDLLDGPGRIVMGTITADCDDEQATPTVLPIAALGEIVRHERLPDGRFNLVLLGLLRVRIREVASTRPYRKVMATPLRERHPSGDSALRLQRELAAAIEARTGVEIEEPEEVSASQLVDILAQSLAMPRHVLEAVFTEEQVATRAAKVLAAHAELPEKRSGGE